MHQASITKAETTQKSDAMSGDYIRTAREIAQAFALRPLHPDERQKLVDTFGNKVLSATARFARKMGVDPWRCRALCPDQ